MATTTQMHGFNSIVRMNNGVVQYGVGDFNPAPVPSVPPQSQTIAMAFGASSADTYEYARLGVSGTVDLSLAQLVNVATVAFYLNGVLVTGEQSVTFGDNLRAIITRTVPGVQSGVSIEIVPSTAVQSLTVPTTQWATWQDLTGLSLLTTEWEETKNSLVALTGTDGVFQHSARSVEVANAPGFIQFRAHTYNVFFGLNYQGATPTFPASHFTRMKYALFLSGNATVMYQNGGVQQNLITGAGNFAKDYRIRDTGSSVVAEVSSDGGATWPTSIAYSQPYSSASWRADVCAQFLTATIRGVQLSL